jgi:hypothetical protein
MVTSAVSSVAVSGSGRLRLRGEHVEAEMGASFGPFVVVLGEDGAG